ncbi:phage tail protein [Fusobacterium polymorphum]|uniref:phage tail-collar fiber domain-containing protein n=1 Tax=Fusobacterium nucleatum subsp. polymorphum TaxID=76857 RepID=UPI0030CC7CBA
MAFRGLTKKGADYLATRLANELAVEFLKVEIGDGAVVSGQNPKNQTSLISYKKDVRILKKEQENNAINLTIQITNDDITQGFYLKEIGIYVNDSTSNGCLYWYCNEDNAQYIPAKTDSVIAFEIDIRMEVTNSDTTIINWSGKNTWINKDYLEENYTQNGGYKGTAQEIDDRVVSALGKEDGKFPLNEAIQGNVYYFPANKKFYICKETQNRRISVPDVKFEELSIWENRKRLENLISFNSDNNIIKIGNVVIENISVPGRSGVRTTAVKTDFKKIISINLNSSITFGQQISSSQSIHDSFDYVIKNKSLRLYANGNQTVDVSIVGLI